MMRASLVVSGTALSVVLVVLQLLILLQLLLQQLQQLQLVFTGEEGAHDASESCSKWYSVQCCLGGSTTTNTTTTTKTTTTAGVHRRGRCT